MQAVAIIVVLKVFQLFLKISFIPEHLVIKEFPTDGADHLLNEGMGEWDRGDTLEFSYFENAQVGLPAVIGEQRIVIRAQMSWPFLPSYDGVEHVA